MTNDEFIRRIRKAVYEPSINGVISILERPPGRKPSHSLTTVSQWFNGLTSDEKVRLRAAIELAARQAVFGMLTVLDGDRSVSDDDERGTIELRYNSAHDSVLLNDPGEETLHDIFADQVPI